MNLFDYLHRLKPLGGRIDQCICFATVAAVNLTSEPCPITFGGILNSKICSQALYRDHQPLSL